ncbi:Glycosyl transferase family 2 [Selenomonas sp. GACV-9]|nr:Glycosyl transferase family 2 [Selenomonas ruminantium]
MLDLSILIPVYNVENFLERCVNSILHQTINNFEIVLVDDGSTDKSGKICDWLAKKDKRIKVIHKENGGLASARIAGIKNSAGKYIGFVDSDDYVDPTMFEQLLKPTRDCGHVDISIGGHVVDQMDGRITIPCKAHESQVWIDGISAMAEMFKGDKFVWSLCDKIYNRDLFTDDVLACWPNSHGEDTFVNSVVMPKAKKIIFQPIYGYHYCMHSESMMHTNFNPSKLATVYIVAGIMEKYQDYPSLITALSNQLFGYLLTYLKNMQDEAPKYDVELDKCRTIAQKWLINNNSLDLFKRHILEVLLLDHVGFLNWQQSERKKLETNYYCGQKKLYIYGTGIYGRRTAEYLEKNKIKIDGFVVSDYEHKKIIENINYPVYVIDQINTDANILLGLGIENTITVIERLRGKYKNIYPMCVFLLCC